MGITFQDLVSTVSVSRERVLPSIQAFPPLDVDAIGQTLDLDNRGFKAGQAEAPASSEYGRDSADLDILAEIERRARKAHEEYLSQRDLYEGRIRTAILAIDRRTHVEAAGRSALADLQAETVNDLEHLHLVKQQVEERESAFRAFREQHALKRLPKSVKRGHRVFMGLVLVFFILVESILNGMFFAEGSEAGLIGGVVQAFVLSLLNIGPAVLFAIVGVPLLVHYRLAVKMTGLVALIVFVAWLVVLNLSVGHYRDLFISNAGVVQMADLAQRFAGAPLGFDDAKSALLVVLGVGLGVLAVIDVVVALEWYPGFARIDAERQDAIRRFASEKTRCLEGIVARRDRALTEMAAAIDSIECSCFEAQLASEGRMRLHRDYNAFLDHLAAAFERLTTRYREANRRGRSTPAPSYFDRPPERPGFLEPMSLTTIPDVPDSRRDEVIARIGYYINAVNEAFEDMLPKYVTVSQLTNPAACDHAIA